MKSSAAVALAVTMAFAAGPSAGQSPQPTFRISVFNGYLPIITGTTNLPKGTVLFVNIMKPWLPDAQQRMMRGLPACGDDCKPATIGSNGTIGQTVKLDGGGAFVAGEFSFDGHPFSTGEYHLEISRSVDLKTATVEQIRAVGTVLFVTTVQVPANYEVYRSVPVTTLRTVPSADYYPNATALHYAQARTDFLDSVRLAFFAAGCRVFQVSDNLQQIQAQLIVGLEYQSLTESEPMVASDRTIQRDVSEAENAGIARASQPTACEFWREHPEVVYELRQAAQAASP